MRKCFKCEVRGRELVCPSHAPPSIGKSNVVQKKAEEVVTAKKEEPKKEKDVKKK